MEIKSFVYVTFFSGGDCKSEIYVYICGMENKTSEFLEVIKKERKMQGIHGKDMGVPKSSYSLIESGKRRMSFESFVKFCNRLGIEITLIKKLK